MGFATQQRADFRHPVFHKCMVCLVCAAAPCTFSASDLPKVVRTPFVFSFLIWTYALRRNALRLFRIWSSRSGPNLGVCSILIWSCARTASAFFDMYPSNNGYKFHVFSFLLPWKCAPWRNSEAGVLCAFLTAESCNFSTSNLPKVVRTWCGFCILTWESAFTPQQRAIFRYLIFQKWSEHGVVSAFWLGKVLSRHSNVQFFDIWFSKSGSNMVFCGFCLGAFASQRRHPLL